MISTRKRCDNLPMISIARRMLSDLHMVLSGTFSGMLTGETSLLTSLEAVYIVYTRACENVSV